jgi:hypothetical protein
MGQKLVRFAGLSGTRSCQDASIEVHEVGWKRPSSADNGGHVRWWIGLICALLTGQFSCFGPRSCFIAFVLDIPNGVWPLNRAVGRAHIREAVPTAVASAL